MVSCINELRLKTAVRGLALLAAAIAAAQSCGAGQLEIVPPARTDGTQPLAVDELRHHLARKAKEVPYRFVFARPEDAPEAGPFESRYRVKGGTVWFWGDDSGPDEPWDWGDNRGVESRKRNGTLFAVELFAERELGMRFVWPGEGGVVVTPVERLALRDGAEGSFTTALAKGRIRNYREYKPMPWSDGLKRVMPRELYDAPKPSTFEERDLWLKRNRLQDREFFQYGHSFTRWKDRFVKTHPEFLNLHIDPKTGARERGYVHGREGSDRTKLCVSNEAVVDQVVADWVAEGAPRFLSICENDSGNWCECDNCRALDVVRPGEAPYSFLTDRYVNFWNRVAKKARAVRPDVMLTTYIYSAYRYPPRRERVEYGENMLFGFVCGPTEDAMGMIRAWEAAGMKRFFFRPNYLHTLSCIPRGYEKFFFDQFHEMLDHGMFGVDYDANDFRYVSAIEFYVLARAFADPKAGFETIMDDYASAYGAAADDVKAYYAAIREVGEAQRERRMKALAAESEMDEIRRKAFPRDIEDGRSEEELRAKKDILSRSLARHAAAGDLAADERARLENLVLQAEHAILTFRFMSGIDTLPVEELRARGEALLAFRLEHRTDLPDIYSHVFGLSRPEGRYWSLYAKRLKNAGEQEKKCVNKL